MPTLSSMRPFWSDHSPQSEIPHELNTNIHLDARLFKKQASSDAFVTVPSSHDILNPFLPTDTGKINGNITYFLFLFNWISSFISRYTSNYIIYYNTLTYTKSCRYRTFSSNKSLKTASQRCNLFSPSVTPSLNCFKPNKASKISLIDIDSHKVTMFQINIQAPFSRQNSWWYMTFLSWKWDKNHSITKCCEKTDRNFNSLWKPANNP